MEIGAGTKQDLPYSAVIPTKDRGKIAVKAIAGLLAQTKRPRQIIVIDASTPSMVVPDDLRAQAQEIGVELRCEHHRPSTSAQRNSGVDLVKSPVVLFLDDDVVLSPEYAEALLRRWEEIGFERLGGIVGSSYIPETRRHDALGSALRRVLMLHLYDNESEATTVRLSGKLKYVHHPRKEVVIPAVATMAVMYRTNLARKHRFDERFPGYALGEDLDMAMRLSVDGPILHLPEPRFLHDVQPGDRDSPRRWYYRGRPETYFRLRHLRRAPGPIAAFSLSIAAEAGVATVDSLRERNPEHVRLFVGGLYETLREVRMERRSQRKAELSLKPRPYYVASRAYQRARIIRERRRDRPTWHGIRILGYHRISDDDDVLAVSPKAFREHLERTLEHGITPIHLDGVVDRLQEHVDERCFCVTFDDGYHDNLENALPILRELEIPATVFLATAVIDGEATFGWYDAPPRALTWPEVEELIAGGLVDVQAHTQTHRALPRLLEDEARAEIFESKADIERHVCRPVTSLCYPGGLYGERERRLLREAGFRAGITTDPGVNNSGIPPEALRRTMIYWRDSIDDFEAKIEGRLDQPGALHRWRDRRRRQARAA